MKRTLVVHFANSLNPPNCQDVERTEEHMRLWAEVRGRALVVEDDPSVKPSSAWKCGTDKIYRIVDVRYLSAVGIPIKARNVFACKHYLLVSDVPETEPTQQHYRGLWR